MNDIAQIYRNEILRAVLGPRAVEMRAHDLHRVNQIAERLAESEEAQGILRANGHGKAGMSLLEIARSVPANAPVVLREMFERPDCTADAFRSLDGADDKWSPQ